MADTNDTPSNPSKLSGFPILQTVTGDEYVEVIARNTSGAFKNYRVLASKLRAVATAYDFAVSNGFAGTLEQWLEATHALYTRDASMYGRVLVADNQGVGQWTEVNIGLIDGLQTELDRVLLEVYNAAAETKQAAQQAAGALGTVVAAKDAAEGFAASAQDSATLAVDSREAAEGFANTASVVVGQIGDSVTLAVAAKDAAESAAIQAVDAAGAAEGFAGVIGTVVADVQSLVDVAVAAKDAAVSAEGTATEAAQLATTVKEAVDTAVLTTQGLADQSLAARDAAEGFANTASTVVGEIQDSVAVAIAAKETVEAAIPLVTTARDDTVAAALEAATTKDAITVLAASAQTSATESLDARDASEAFAIDALSSVSETQAAALEAVTAKEIVLGAVTEAQESVGDALTARDASEAFAITALASATETQAHSLEVAVAKEATDEAVVETQTAVAASLTARDASEAFAIASLSAVTETQADALESVTAKIAAQAAANQAQQAVTEAENVVAEGISGLTDPSASDGLGFRRSVLAETITSVNLMLSGLTVNIWEYADRIIDKPTLAPSTWDWTPARNAATAYVKSKGGGWVRYPAGTYPHSVFTKLHSVSDLGDGSSATYITALPRSSAVPYGMVEIDKGAVSSSHIVGIHFQGSVIPGHAQPTLNADQWGLYAKAQWDDAYFHGGWWFSELRDVRFSNFNKGGWTRGGYTNNNYKRPIQFLTFDKVFFQVPAGGEALRMTGQHGQIDFRGGSAEGRDGVTAWRCVTLDWDPDPSTMADPAANQGEDPTHIPGQATAVLSPINVTFGSEFSMQKSQYGAYARNCRSIFFQECWLEGIGKLFTLATNAQVHVAKNHLANAADGTRFLPEVTEGYIYTLSGNSYLSFAHDNEFQGIVDNYLDPTVDFNAINGLNVKGMPSGNTLGKFKAGSNKTLLVDGTTLDIKAHKYAVFNPGADPTVKLANLTATAAPGETVMIRPLNGTLTLTNTGNISLNGLGNLTVPQFGMVTLLRVFQIGVSPAEWVVVSCTEHHSTVKPVNGFYYAAGTRIWQPGAAPNTPMGWVCTQAGLAGSTAIFRDMPNVGST